MFLSRAVHRFPQRNSDILRRSVVRSVEFVGVNNSTTSHVMGSGSGICDSHSSNNPSSFFSCKTHHNPRQCFSTNNETHLPRNENARHKLHIGFASLSSTLPFSSPPPTSSPEDGGKNDTKLDPRSSIMLTALRGGVSSFDCPSPPLIDAPNNTGKSTFVPSQENNLSPCWYANRQSEIQMVQAVNQAWSTLLEEDDGEAMQALKVANNNEGEKESVVTISCRLGYRSAVVVSEDTSSSSYANSETNNDYQEREGSFPGDARVGLLFPGKEIAGDETNEDTISQPPVVLLHNLSEEYVLHSLRTSPLIQQYKVIGNGSEHNKKKVKIISLAHNPETQIAAFLTSHHGQSSSKGGDKAMLRQETQHFMKKSLTSAFVGYEHAVKEGLIDGYGVCSNGLSLPNSHDMFLSWRSVLECAIDAYLRVNGNSGSRGEELGRSSLKTIRLPGNLFETRGLDVAKEICSFFHSGESSSNDEGLPSFTEDSDDPLVQQRRKLRKMRNLLPKSLEVYVTRPLTAYPYGGTGWESNSPPGLTESSGLSAPPSLLKGGSGESGGGSAIDATHPIRLLDYQIEHGGIGQAPEMMWTNQHHTNHGPRPSAYQPILNAALSHFDAEFILDASRERPLTVEERETLDGCKLLRDMIHDLDASLDNMKSFAAYEEYLLNVAVPLIYGSFEELDEESAGMLQLFFRVHGMAVRMVVARWTRELLLGGWKRVDLVNDVDQGDENSRTKDKDQEKKISKIWNSYGFGEYVGGYDIPEDVTLQDFALRQLLDDDAIQGVVVGCSSPEHALEAMRTADASTKCDEKKQ